MLACQSSHLLLYIKTKELSSHFCITKGLPLVVIASHPFRFFVHLYQRSAVYYFHCDCLLAHVFAVFFLEDYFCA